MRDLKIITVQPDACAFWWTVAVQLYNAKRLGIEKYFQVLVFQSFDRRDEGFHPKWKFLEKKFPEAKFFYYKDTDNITEIFTTFNYIPLLRPWTLKQHWQKFPELQKDAVFYIDSDVLFTRFPQFLFDVKDNETVYASNAKSYISAEYFDSKIKDVILSELDVYKETDILNTAAGFCGINRKICEQNNEKSGGAQYFLKNIPSNFWQQVFDASLKIRTYLMAQNKRFFASEDAGIQSWCSDIWATIWTLWARGDDFQTPKEFDFCWASNYVSEWENTNIYHDASAMQDPFQKDGKTFRTFFKRGNRVKVDNHEFHDYMLSWEMPQLKTPFDDDLSWVSPELCSYNYVQEILQTKKYLNQ